MMIVQQGPKDCAAACLAMVTGIRLESAREILASKGWIEDEGAKPCHLLEALESLNFSSKYSYGRFLMDHYDSLINKGTAILTVKSKTRIGGWHYIVMHDGSYYDPQEGNVTEIYARGESKVKVLNACIDIIQVEVGL